MGYTIRVVKGDHPLFLSEFLITSFQNTRSSHRTNLLHEAVLNELLNENAELHEYTWQYEYKLPCDAYGGTFDIDIVGLNDQGEVKIAVLVKAINSNVNKNIKNYANTSVGEAARIYYAPDSNIEKIIFVSILPRIAPRFNNTGEVAGFDDVISAKNRTVITNVLQQQYSGAVIDLNIYYDIGDVKNKTTKDEFMSITVDNLDPVCL